MGGGRKGEGFQFALDVSETHYSFCFRSVLQEVLNQKEAFQSLRRDVLPYLVRSQLVCFDSIFSPYSNAKSIVGAL